MIRLANQQKIPELKANIKESILSKLKKPNEIDKTNNKINKISFKKIFNLINEETLKKK